MSCTSIDTAVDQITGDRNSIAQIVNNFVSIATGDENTDVVFNLGSEHTVPSISKKLSQLDAAGLADIKTIQAQTKAVQSGLIQQAEKLNASLRIANNQSPYWETLDLSDDNSPDLDKTNLFWDAHVEAGAIRFDFAVEQPVVLNRQYETDGKKIGDWLMPSYVETTHNLYISALPAANDATTTQENVAKYGAITRTVTLAIRNYHRYYYGHYYYWYRRYLGAYAYTTIQTTTVTEGLTNSLSAQSFQIDSEKVLLGVNMLVKNPGGTKATANPKVMLVENSLGMPVLTNVLAKGTLYDNVAAASSDNAVLVRFDMDVPNILRANKSYSIVAQAEGESTWEIWYNDNENNTGQIFYTQDGDFWTADLGKDFIIQLIVANFGEGFAESIIPMGNMSVSDGFSSANMTKYAELPTSYDVTIEIETSNGVWNDVAIVDSLGSQPSSVNIRARFEGERYVAPLLDTKNSKLTGFRPRKSLTFYSSEQNVPNLSGTLEVTYNLEGFDETDEGTGPMHTFTPQIQVDGETVAPLVTTLSGEPDDQGITQFICVYDLPVDTTTYKHFLQATTLLATKTFDITTPIVSKQVG